ncbi:MAG TPA: exodeoxyribonuclease VII small subunit [Spirochaetia bacterium]|nr:exodeoxyribonuclease VII small subunit [Spirochaetales bacterium]HRS64296.1 exodeoxyribonuclease VII small subunit [Spirochaetia bacterium]HOT58323.1 exodeoxyribonuclease VII small subunit [Spirochaetales bacterium]HPD80071.1 exodeoxyribonuclease VII small subunit [Spirochaetales bacterium]HQG39507.1 exodeoxyribonuclease VII small subunit [Spirochaetales bacterium]
MKKIEERLEELESIADKLRNEDIPLDEAIKLFEEGMKLSKTLDRDLRKIETKVQILMNESDNPEFQDFDTDDTTED